MKCPACNTMMTVKNYESSSMHECEACRSVWLGSDALSGVVKSTAKAFSQDEVKAVFAQLKKTPQAVRNLKCPQCSAALLTHHYAADMELQIDRCPNDHGVFLDNAELEAIQIKFEDRAAPGSGGAMNKTVLNPGQRGKLCPRDGSALNALSYESETIDLCPRCGGVWCDGSELGQIIKSRVMQHGDALFPEYKGQESGAHEQTVDLYSDVTPCVICAAPMTHLNYCANSGIMIDTCRMGHGTWLDRSELERVQVFAERWEKNIDAVYAKHAQKLASVAAQTAADYDAKERSRKEKERNLSTVGRVLKSIFGRP